MPNRIKKTLRRMRESPASVRFKDLCLACEHDFGPPRETGGSHRVYRTPWSGDPRINVQEGENGSAKRYQIRQVLAAIERLEKDNEPEE